MTCTRAFFHMAISKKIVRLERLLSSLLVFYFGVLGPVSVSRYTARLRAIGADLGTGH